jgi:rhodanese-related sulfurtransferase
MLREPLLVDVREPYHLSAKDLQVAVNVPLGVLLAEPTRLPRDRPLVLFGHDAAQADFAASYLRRFGYDARRRE